MAGEVLLSAFVAVALTAIAVASGSRVRTLARIPLPPSARLPFEAGLGYLTLGGFAILLGLAGWFRGPVLVSVAVLAAVTGKWRGPKVMTGAAWAVLGALPLLPLSLAAPFFYDAMVYHLGLPWQALLDGRISAHAEDLFSTFPPLAQGVFAFPLAVGLPRAAGLVHWLSVVLAGSAVYTLALRLGAKRATAAAAALALPLIPVLGLVSGFPAAEGWMLLATVTAVGLALSPAPSVGVAAAAGVMAGAATGFRLQGLVWAGLIFVVVLLRSRRGAAAAAFAAMAAVAAAPWWLKNLVLLGSPLAPVGWNREGIETLWRDAGSRVHLITQPGRLLAAAAADIAPYAVPLALLGLPAVLAVVQRGEKARWAAVLVVAGVAAWTVTGALPRFLAPSFAVLLAVTAASGVRYGKVATHVALAGIIGLGAVVLLGDLRRLGLPPFSSSAVGYVVNDPRPAFAEAAALPADSRVLFIGEPRGFGFPRRFVAPSQHDVSPLRDVVEEGSGAEEVRVWLLRQGFSHLLVNQRELDRLAPRYPVTPWRTASGRRSWVGFVDGLAPPVVSEGGVVIVAIPDSPPPPGAGADAGTRPPVAGSTTGEPATRRVPEQR